MVVAGLRPMMALALVAWGLKQRWIRPGRSPYGRIVYTRALSRIADCAIGELIADKLMHLGSLLFLPHDGLEIIAELVAEHSHNLLRQATSGT